MSERQQAASQEFLRVPDPKRTIHTRKSLTRLVKDNPLTGIISHTNYHSKFGKHGELFDPDPAVFQDIHTVNVQTVDGRIIKRIKDGHHRTRFTDTHWDELTLLPGFSFATYDVTKNSLRRFYGPDESIYPEALTMQEFWLDTIEDTIQHAEIETKRTLGQFFLSWEDEVGKDVAKTFTAFTAIIYLTNNRIRQQTRNSAHDKNQIAIDFSADPQRDTKIAGLHSIDAVLTRLVEQTTTTTKRSYKEILNEALLLVTVDDHYIGGSEIGIREIEGLIHLPALESKIQGRTSLADKIKDDLAEAFRRHKKRILFHFTDIYNALVGDYTLEQISEIVRSNHPSGKLKKFDRQRDFEQRCTEYERQVGQSPTDIEKQLLKRTGKNELSFANVKQTVTSLHQAQEAARQIHDPHLQQKIEAWINKILHQQSTDYSSAIRDLMKFIAEPEIQPTTPHSVVARKDLTRLQEENTQLRQYVALLEETLTNADIPLPFPPAGDIVTEKDILVKNADVIAKKILAPNEQHWDTFVEQITYQDRQGQDAVTLATKERLQQFIDDTGWTINTPQVQLTLAYHYLGMFRVSGLFDQKTEIDMRKAVADFKHKHPIPENPIYIQILQLLFYSQPADTVRNDCVNFLKKWEKRRNYIEAKDTILQPYLRRIGKHWKPFLREAQRGM